MIIESKRVQHSRVNPSTSDIRSLKLRDAALVASIKGTTLRIAVANAPVTPMVVERCTIGSYTPTANGQEDHLQEHHQEIKIFISKEMKKSCRPQKIGQQQQPPSTHSSPEEWLIKYCQSSSLGPRERQKLSQFWIITPQFP